MRATGKTLTGVRVGFVYTPEKYRNKKYSKRLFLKYIKNEISSNNNSTICLFADENNPISNHLYRSIGFEKVEMKFALVRRLEIQSI